MELLLTLLGIVVVFMLGVVILIARAHKKVPQGKALIRTGFGGVKVAYDKGMFVIPVLHRMEEMDISLKTIEVNRAGSEGLVCKDNLRADIKVVFFVRVNKSPEDIIRVAQSVGCSRASDQQTLSSLFDAKFSEALKTVGKQFDFVELYTARDRFKAEILRTIGQDLNGYELDDCAIDYLEQTPIGALRQDNILDSEGIKKIEELTSIQIEKTNFIRREREKTIKRQDVEAREAILQLELQQTEKEERQKRSISVIKSQQESEAKVISTEEQLKASLKIKEAQEKDGIAEENKLRQILVARKNKERTEAVENERIETDRLLEVERKERAVGEARIDKEKVLEAKKRDIQSIIKERKAEEKKTVEEDQRIQDTIQIAEAERLKKVAIVKATEEAESLAIKQTRQAEVDKIAAEVKGQQMIIEADAKKTAILKESEARKIAAEAQAAEEATIGLAEADVMNAKAEAKEKDGLVEARLLEAKAEAERKKGLAEVEVLREKGLTEAQVMTVKVDAKEKDGLTDAKVLEQKALAEAKGITAKAEAMKLFSEAGKDHEEFKLRLQQQKELTLAELAAQQKITEAQAMVLAEALRNAKIDIVGGESQFFHNVLNAISKGKSLDRMVDSSQHLTDFKAALLGGGKENLLQRIKAFADQYGMGSDTLRNLSLAAVLTQLYAKAGGGDKNVILELLENVTQMGMGADKANF